MNTLRASNLFFFGVLFYRPRDGKFIEMHGDITAPSFKEARRAVLYRFRSQLNRPLWRDFILLEPVITQSFVVLAD